MTSTYVGKPCPKCSHVRAAAESAPDWQCPKCGIAYVKFEQANSGTSFNAAVHRGSGGASASAAKEADLDLTGHAEVFITQKFEVAELFGFEARNRYRISDAAGKPIGYAAEEQTGGLGFLVRQILGHWRTFEIHFFNNAREVVLHASHPFRFYFARLDVYDSRQQLIGAIEKRFSILTKRFCVENDRGVPIMEVNSPIWKIWTFPFVAKGREVASVNKKWSGVFTEAFTDRDNFQVKFSARELSNDERKVILAAAIYVDLMYFERKA